MSSGFDAFDHACMAQALQLAVRGLYTTQPNPRVGCVIVRDGVVVGRGFHRQAGGLHAEAEALAEAGEQARGATVYSLREGVANYLKRSASREVVNTVLSDQDKTVKQSKDFDTIRGFLSGLVEREVEVTKERTSVFARSLVEYMSASTTMMNNPDRTAAFAVLKTAKVPAVLVELAFVTNREDAKRLQSDEWRSSVSESLMTAIEEIGRAHV